MSVTMRAMRAPRWYPSADRSLKPPHRPRRTRTENAAAHLALTAGSAKGMESARRGAQQPFTYRCAKGGPLDDQSYRFSVAPMMDWTNSLDISINYWGSCTLFVP